MSKNSFRLRASHTSQCFLSRQRIRGSSACYSMLHRSQRSQGLPFIGRRPIPRLSIVSPSLNSATLSSEILLPLEPGDGLPLDRGPPLRGPPLRGVRLFDIEAFPSGVLSPHGTSAPTSVCCLEKPSFAYTVFDREMGLTPFSRDALLEIPPFPISRSLGDGAGEGSLERPSKRSGFLFAQQLPQHINSTTSNEDAPKIAVRAMMRSFHLKFQPEDMVSIALSPCVC